MDSCYRRSPQVASRVIEGEAVLVKMPENLLFVLNAAASRVWVRADGARSGTELGRGWDAEEIGAFLDEMVEHGLFERTSSPAEKADEFPQDVAWPETGGPREPPKILSTELMGVMAGCALTAELVCEIPFLMNS